jgi:hypothetical protein
MRGVQGQGRTQKLYQRLFNWARFRSATLGSSSAGPSVTRVVHTDVVVERQGMTVLLSGAAAADFDTCPLCGQSLAPAQTAQIQASLQKGAASRQVPRGEA